MKGAAQAVQRQASWSSLAHDMTAEYRVLCAEEVRGSISVTCLGSVFKRQWHLSVGLI